MADDAAVMDVGAETGADLDVDTGADTGAVDDGAAGAGDGGDQGGADGGADGQSAPPLQGKELHQALRNHLAEVRTKNPSLAREIKEAVYARNELRREFPGGLQEAREIRDTLSGISATDAATGAELSGREALEMIQRESAYLQELDKDFSGANPALWDKLADAQPEAFVKLMPAAIDKLEQMAPEAFASLIAGRMIADMAQEGVIDDLKWLARVAGDNKEVKDIAARALGYLQRLGGFAQKPFEAPKNLARQDNQPRGGEDRVAARERELNMREFRAEHSQVAAQSFNTELQKHLAGRKVTDDQKAAIVELVSNALNRAETPEDRKKIDRYFAAGDKAGYLQFKRTILDRALSGAVERAVAVTIGRKPGPSGTAAKPQQRTGAVQTGKTSANTAPGIKVVNQRPHQNDVDWRRTSPQDTMKDIFTLRDGSRVQFRG